MEELFISAEEMRSMHNHFRVLSAYVWAAVVVPADRPRLMQALVCAALDRTSVYQVDTALEC